MLHPNTVEYQTLLSNLWLREEAQSLLRKCRFTCGFSETVFCCWNWNNH